MSSTLTKQDIMSALQAVHTAADEYYTVRHALAWNTDFVFSCWSNCRGRSVISRLCYDFAKMCRYKQSKLAHNQLSTERILSFFGPTGTTIPGVSLIDFNTLIEFATYGIMWHHSTYCTIVRTILSHLHVLYTVRTIYTVHCTHCTCSLFPCFRCWGFTICSHTCSLIYKFTFLITVTKRSSFT